jgi:hypothetical protein
LERIALQKEPEQGALDLVMEFCLAIEEVTQVLAKRSEEAGNECIRIRYCQAKKVLSCRPFTVLLTFWGLVGGQHGMLPGIGSTI